MKLITKNNKVVQVTTGAFDEIYSKQGWKVVPEKKAKEKKQEANEEEKKQAALEKEIEEIKAKPLGQWKAAEVKTYAAFNDIDLKGTKNAEEAKDVIKEHLG